MASSISSSATSSISTRPMRRFTPPIRIPIFLSEHSKPSSLSHHTTRSITTSTTTTTTRCQIRDLSPTDARNGADILIEALEREGVMDVFTYPGGASLEVHHALMRSPDIRNHLLRHEHGASFGASGYARSTGKTGVCVTAWGPDRANLISALADALLDSVPMVAITGQVRISRRMIGEISAYRETPRVEMLPPMSPIISKHTYFVEDVDDIPRIIKEAFMKATSSTPGPVLVLIPVDIQI